MNSSGNHKAEDLQVLSVAKSCRNNFSVANSYGKFYNFENLNLGFPFLCNLEWDLVGGPTNGDTLGEAVISV